MPSRTTSPLIRHLITSVFNLTTIFTRRKRGLPSRCAFVFSQELTLSTEDEDDDDIPRVAYDIYLTFFLRGLYTDRSQCYFVALSSSTQHPSSDDCPEDKKKDANWCCVYDSWSQ